MLFAWEINRCRDKPFYALEYVLKNDFQISDLDLGGNESLLVAKRRRRASWLYQFLPEPTRSLCCKMHVHESVMLSGECLEGWKSVNSDALNTCGCGKHRRLENGIRACGFCLKGNAPHQLSQFRSAMESCGEQCRHTPRISPCYARNEAFRNPLQS